LVGCTSPFPTSAYMLPAFRAGRVYGFWIRALCTIVIHGDVLALSAPASSSPTPSSPAWAAPGSHLNSHLPRAHRLHLHPPGPSSSIRNLPSSLASPTPLWARRFICTRAHRFICHKPTVKATMHNQVNISRDLPHLPHLPRASWYSPRDLSEPWRWAGIPRPVTACFFRVLTDCENQWGSSKLPQACLRT